MSSRYPQHDDATDKFKPATTRCAPGVPVTDTAFLFSGEPCCSACRSTMREVLGVWVHARTDIA